ncbi:MAG: hypothetical protein K2I67_02970, partial [Malacoplasma sp.]|nr:hypothetical protein [Malacoplasma sp.]
MKLKNKKLLGWFSLLLPIVATSVAVPLSITTNQSELNSNKNVSSTNLDSSESKKIIYNGKYYSSVEDAANDVLANSKSIQDKFMIGDLQDAIFDTQTKRLDESKLKDYDISKLSKVYQTASGKYVDNYQEAKNSYVNNALVTEAYDDLNGNIFHNENDALNSLRSHTKGVPVPYYEVEDSNNNKVKINPLNKDDIDKFKEIAAAQILNPTNDKFKLDLYLKDENGNFVKHNDQNSEIYQSDENAKNVMDAIKDEFWNAFTEEFRNVLPEVPVTLNIGFQKFPGDHPKWGYLFGFNGRTSSTINLTQNNGKKLTLGDIINSKNSQKNTIYAFLDRGTLEKSSGSVRTKVNTRPFTLLQKIASEFYDVNVYGNKFSIFFTGDDIGGSPGIDFELLKRGTEGTSTDGDSGYNIGSTRFSLSLNINQEDLNNLIDKFANDENRINELKEKFKNKLLKNYPNFFKISIINKISNEDLKKFLKDN